MIIIHNPKDGAPISDFIFQSTKIDPHLPEGYRLEDGKRSKGLMQYPDAIGNALLDTFIFLRAISEEEAKQILEREEAEEFECDFAGCQFVTTTKVALIGHKKKHNLVLSANEKPVLDTNLVPVAGGKKVISLAEKKKMMDNRVSDIPNGPDGDGVDWYGEGVKVENHSNSQFNASRPQGAGHFKG